MGMTWTTLTADKNTPGSVASWIRYSKLDTNQVVDEAQAYLYQRLRLREMRTHVDFNMATGSSRTTLPTGFLEPIGQIYSPTNNLMIQHRDETFVLVNRNWQETSGTFGVNAFTTTNGQTTVSILLTGHGFTQESEINIAGASAIGGITPNGTFDVISITDANNFVIDTLTQTATSSATGGAGTETYLVDVLTTGSPFFWAIWDELIHFDCAFNQSYNCQLQYFKSLPLLSATNLTNVLTNRYPQLLRKACQAMAADFMQNSEEFLKLTQNPVLGLEALIQGVNVENEMFYRGMIIDTETP